MTRVGMNPARGEQISYRPQKVTVAVLTYIPGLSGYFKQRLEILKLTLASIYANTKEPYDLMVFSNGSCQEVNEFLQSQVEAGRINYLLLSHRNIGVIGAFKILFAAAPGEFIAYSDDDVIYEKDWLAEHLKILDAYPRVGMVSGAPVGYSTRKASTSLDRFLADNEDGLRVEEISRNKDWEQDWAESTGRDQEEHLTYAEQNPLVMLEYNQVQAVKSAKHFQFLSPKSVLLEALPEFWDGKLMDGLVELDQVVDALGYLRLSTPQRYSRHIGNVIKPEIAEFAQDLGEQIISDPPSNGSRHWLLNIPGTGRVLRKIYNFLFRILHDIK